MKPKHGAIVLCQPEIAGNVGNIIRTAACFSVSLYIIRPMGFAWDERTIKRYSVSYGSIIEGGGFNIYSDYTEYLAQHPNSRRICFVTPTTNVSKHCYYSIHYRQNDHLIFGCESYGLDMSVLVTSDQNVTIPIDSKADSINLASSVGIGCSEYIRQITSIV